MKTTVQVTDLHPGDQVDGGSDGTYIVREVTHQPRSVIVTFDRDTPGGRDVVFMNGEILEVHR